MAGLWDKWLNHEGKPVFSYAVITTTPQPELTFIHDRMPVILQNDNLDRWLQTAENPTSEVLPLLAPFSANLEAYPVSTLVNSPANNSLDCIGRL